MSISESIPIIVAVTALCISLISLYFSIRAVRAKRLEKTEHETITNGTLSEEIKGINMNLGEIRERIKDIKQDVGYIKQRLPSDSVKHGESPPIDRLKGDEEEGSGPTFFPVDKF